MRSGNDLHAAVLTRCGVERDPDAEHQIGVAAAEIGRVLVPGLLAADLRRLHQRHLLQQHAPLPHQRVEHGVKPGRHRRAEQRRRRVGEVAELPDQIGTVRGGGRGRVGGRFQGDEGAAGVTLAGRQPRIGGQGGQRGEAGVDVLARQDPAHDQVAVAPVLGDRVQIDRRRVRFLGVHDGSLDWRGEDCHRLLRTGSFAIGAARRSRIAQLVEQAAVNRWVAGSSPAPGANQRCL